MQKVNITFNNEYPFLNKIVELQIARGQNGSDGTDGKDGAPGKDGQDGTPGQDGQDGKNATITIGNVSTGEPGTQASVTNRGDENAAILDFVIPRGADGNGDISEEDLASKADLDPETGCIMSNQIAPLEGRQTGVCTATGYFISEVSSLRSNTSETFVVTFATGDQTSTQNECIFSQSDSEKGLKLILSQDGSLKCHMGANNFTLSGVSIAPNKLYHVAMVFDSVSGTLTVYINGNLADSLNVSNAGDVPDYFCIGSDNGADNFTHTLCDVRMFNYAITSNEVTVLWHKGSPYEYIIPDSLKGAGTNKCIAEYLAYGLLADAWRDTSGNHLNLSASGNPSLIYNTPASTDDTNDGTSVIESPLGDLDIPSSPTKLGNAETVKSAIEKIGSQLNGIGNGTAISSWREPGYGNQGIKIANAAYCELELDSTGIGRYQPNGTYTGNIPVFRYASSLPEVLFGNTTYSATISSSPTINLRRYDENGYCMFNPGDTAILSLKGAFSPTFSGNNIYYESGYSSVVPDSTNVCVYRVTFDGSRFLVSRKLYETN